MKAISYLFTFLIVLIFACGVRSHGIGENNDDLFCRQYYSKITQADCKELITIKKNYSNYGLESKELALLRVKQIEQKLLDIDVRANILLAELDSSYFGDMPMYMMGFIIEQFKAFKDLTHSDRIALIKDRITLIENSKPTIRLSKKAQNYKTDKVMMLS